MLLRSGGPINLHAYKRITDTNDAILEKGLFKGLIAKRKTVKWTIVGYM